MKINIPDLSNFKKVKIETVIISVIVICFIILGNGVISRDITVKEGNGTIGVAVGEEQEIDYFAVSCLELETMINYQIVNTNNKGWVSPYNNDRVDVEILLYLYELRGCN